MNHRLPWLDFLRGTAALLVVLEHLRAFLFAPYSTLRAPGILIKGFYGLTGLGHQAVMVFFVLSGFLVGGSVFRGLESGAWRWREYLLKRLSRLWTVLLPALLLTMFWDGWGHALHPEGYGGQFRELYHSGPVAGESPADTPLVFFGNLLFLQTIMVPCFGTDSPLWSLANEFWYYLLFPLFLRTFYQGRAVSGFVSFAAGLALLWFLPAGFIPGFVIWTMGAITFRMTCITKVPGWIRSRLFLTACLILACGVLIWTRFSAFPWVDLVLGLALLPLTWSLSLHAKGGRWLHGISGALSEISYTLYLVHFPLLAWIFFTLFRGQQMMPDGRGFLLFFSILLLVLLYSSVAWWCFERNTDRIRRWIGGLFPPTKGAGLC